MKLNELKNDVAMLGFESEIKDTDCFISSANRAIEMIYTDRPVSASVTIAVSLPKISYHKDFIVHCGGEDVVIPVTGKAVYFRSSGKGECIITDSTGGNLIYLKDDLQTSTAVIMGDAVIKLTGDYHYTVSDLTVYSELYSKTITDIKPYYSVNELDMNDYVSNFKSFESTVKDSNGVPVAGCVLHDGKITLPHGYTGNIRVSYYRTPTPIDADDENIKLDISEEVRPLLSILTASFMWLDDDSAKAQYYMNLYREAMASIKRYSKINMDTEYRVNGWA